MGRRRQRGFSLLELLVTLFIVVLVTSLVTLNVGTGGADYEMQGAVEGLADSANYALDEAQFAGWDYGLLITVENEQGGSAFRLQWLERGPDRWRDPLSGKDVFAEVMLPPDVELQLELDGILQEQEIFTRFTELPTPQIVLYASGETAPGALDFIATQSGDLLWRLEWDMLGNFRALRRGEPLAEDDL